MCTDHTHETSLLGLLDRLRDLTGRLVEFVMRPIPVDVLEMEDVLFHLNSSVLMPEAPAGESSADGAEPTAEQAAVTGITSLALAYRQFEFDPEKVMLIAGHTDTSGGYELNFTLSRQRAENVLFLLTGESGDWCRNCANRHKVEDYQQIVEYFHRKSAAWKGGDWDCDPEGLDDDWGPNTRRAVNNFARSYNELYTGYREPDSPAPPSNLGDVIQNRPGHTWPEDSWHAVYNLYVQVLLDTLGKTPDELAELRARLRFIADDRRIFGCGESFPLDQRGRDGYRSQQNRRVEILFMPANQAPAPERMVCPADVDRAHVEAECPLWHPDNLEPTYIPAADLHAVAYHLRFRYFDRIRKEERDVPAGLQLRALVDDEEIPTRTVHNDGLYTAVVQFPTRAAADAGADDVQLRFETTDRWVRTTGPAATPGLVTRAAGEVAVLPCAERMQYYDLPSRWCSRNWRCKVGDTVDDWEEHVKTRTSGDSPIVFNLDDIVLTKNDGSQAITDRSGRRTSSAEHGEPKALSAEHDPSATPPKFRSRVRILFVDPDTNKLDLYRSGAAGAERMLVSAYDPAAHGATASARHADSIIPFQTRHDGTTPVNLIKDPPGGARAVVFCGEFYDVAGRRTLESNPDFDLEAGHILGARAARLNDEDVHRRTSVLWTDARATIHTRGIGDFDLHYLHEGDADADHVYSHLVVYWSTFVTKDTKPTGGTGDETEPTDAEVAEFLDKGMLNAMKRWNVKEYRFEEHGRAADDTSPDRVVLPFFLFDANEAFKLVPPHGPALDFADDYGRAIRDLFEHDNMTRALRQARGGAPKSLTFVTEEKKGSWVQSAHLAWCSYSLVSLRIKTREDDAGRFASLWPHTEFGDPGQYGCLVIAHEIGHATGQVDDYEEDVTLSYTRTDGKPGKRYFPCYGLFGLTAAGHWITAGNTNFSDRVQGSDPYPRGHDNRTLMDKNGPIRMRHVWRFGHWVNEGAKTGGDLHALLREKQFQMVYPHPSPALTYHRTTATNVDPWRFSHGDTPSAGPDRPMNVYLFQVLDETRRRSGTGGDTDFGAIVVVRPRFFIRVVDNGAHHRNANAKAAWAYNFHRLLSGGAIDGKFKLAGGGGALDPTLMRVIPGYHFVGEQPGTPSEYNFKIEVKRNSNDAIDHDGDEIQLGDQRTARELVNHLFVKSATATSFVTSDFAFVANWFSGADVANARFRVEEV